MNYPELLLLPLLMMTDYLLTLVAASIKEKKYADHFKVQHYELNPIWQKDVSHKKWVNPRHIFLVVDLCTALRSSRDWLRAGLPALGLPTSSTSCRDD